MRIGSCFIRKRKKNFSNFRAKKKKISKERNYNFGKIKKRGREKFFLFQGAYI